MGEGVLMMMMTDWWMYQGVMVVVRRDVLKLGDVSIGVDGVPRRRRRSYWLLRTWWTECAEM